MMMWRLTREAFLRVSSLPLLQQALSIALDPNHCGRGWRPDGAARTQCSFIFQSAISVVPKENKKTQSKDGSVLTILASECGLVSGKTRLIIKPWVVHKCGENSAFKRFSFNILLIENRSRSLRIKKRLLKCDTDEISPTGNDRRKTRLQFEEIL